MLPNLGRVRGGGVAGGGAAAVVAVVAAVVLAVAATVYSFTIKLYGEYCYAM